MKYLPLSILSMSLAAAGLSTGWSEEKETRLNAADVPAAVKATLEKAANGAQLSEFEREQKQGKTVYTAEIPGTEKGTVTEFTVAEDGTLLGQETEKSDGDKEDGEKGEHKGHRRD
jgi:hypothetical protein